MESYNKLPSFGDDTLSACIQVETKNMDTVNNANDTSSELNPSISVIPTQDRCKLISWGLPPNILQVNIFI